ncbi:hypothetical protein SCUP515_10240 [Seiridium cupressi]
MPSTRLCANDFGRVGPYNANSEEWLQAVKASDFTGIFNIPGYDVSKPWPGNTVDGWRSLVVAMDVSGSSYFEAERMVGYSMTLEAPNGSIGPSADGDGAVIVDLNPSWGLCFWNWESPSYGNKSLYNHQDTKPLATDGCCTVLLSDTCIAALEKEAATDYYISDETYGPYNSTLVCRAFDTPSECGEAVGNSFAPMVASKSSLSNSGLPIQYLNGPVTEQDGWEID